MTLLTNEITGLLEARNQILQRKATASLQTFDSIKILGWELEYASLDALLSAIDQILVRRLNDFVTFNTSPVIIDCGANIGLSVLAYKKRFPKAKIIAFEPDPVFSPILKRNLALNGAGDVEVVEAAAWTTNGTQVWCLEGNDGSRILQPGQTYAKTTTVRTIDLSAYLDKPVDLLKIDIEGAEYEVIPHLQVCLANVKSISLECHLDVQIKGLLKILEVLQKSGFQISLNSFGNWRDLVRQPTLSELHSHGYLLVSCWRDAIPPIFTESEPAWLPAAGIDALVALQELHNKSEETERSLLKQMHAFASTESLGNLKNTKRPIYTLLQGPFSHQGGCCWSQKIKSLSSLSDNEKNDSVSSLRLYEDGVPLLPGHALHQNIREKGGGRFSHWHEDLFFSSSDGTDPNTNGRIYTIIIST